MAIDPSQLTPAPASQPAASAPAPQPAAPAPLSNAASLMLSQFRLLDPTRQAVGLDKLRPFYPRIGWNIILATVHELENAKLLTKKGVPNPKGGVGYHVYTWQEG